MTETPNPISTEMEDHDWELEQRAFQAANATLPIEVYQQLIRDLWATYCGTDQSLREAREALGGLANFAWSAVQADCEESRGSHPGAPAAPQRRADPHHRTRKALPVSAPAVAAEVGQREVSNADERAAQMAVDEQKASSNPKETT